MSPKICLDAGVLDIHFSKNCTQKVKKLMDSILRKDIQAYILRSILIESYYHLCKLKGNEIAQITITSFLNKYPINLVHISNDLIYSAGKLKCQNRKTLSYNDCLSIAFCLNKKVAFHTTEKNLEHVPNTTLKRLKIEKYRF
ncbi:MAG: PIN domain-containing protein [Promethearchaeia archaeon]